MDDIPTVAQTHEAKAVFLKGFEAHYPGLDPRLSLLGLKENGYEYITEKYGRVLVEAKSKTSVLIDKVISSIPWLMVIYVIYTHR